MVEVELGGWHSAAVLIYDAAPARESPASQFELFIEATVVIVTSVLLHILA